ncbi:MAG: hypothetical protein WD995_13840 [Gemmatimonadota bacterium]
MCIPFRATLVALLFAVLLPAPARVAAQMEAFGDPARLVGAAPLAVRAVVEWDELITETAGGATEDQFHQAVIETFEASLGEMGVPVDDAAERMLVCRVETFYNSGSIAFAARVEFHEPFGRPGQTAITWHRTWIGTTSVQGMHLLFRIGEQCAEDFAEAWRAANPG